MGYYISLENTDMSTKAAHEISRLKIKVRQDSHSPLAAMVGMSIGNDDCGWFDVEYFNDEAGVSPYVYWPGDAWYRPEVTGYVALEMNNNVLYYIQREYIVPNIEGAMYMWISIKDRAYNELYSEKVLLTTHQVYDNTLPVDVPGEPPSELIPIEVLQVTPYKRDVYPGESIGIDVTIRNNTSVRLPAWIMANIGTESPLKWTNSEDYDYNYSIPDYIQISPGEVQVYTFHIIVPSEYDVRDIRAKLKEFPDGIYYDSYVKSNVLNVVGYAPPTHAQVELQNTGHMTFAPRIGYSILPEGASLWKDAPLTEGASFDQGAVQTLNTGSVSVPVGVHGKVYAWLRVYDPNNKVIASAGGPGDTSVYFDVY